MMIVVAGISHLQLNKLQTRIELENQLDERIVNSIRDFNVLLKSDCYKVMSEVLIKEVSDNKYNLKISIEKKKDYIYKEYAYLIYDVVFKDGDVSKIAKMYNVLDSSKNECYAFIHKY